MFAKPKLYNPGLAERTLLFQTIADHYAIWLAFCCACQFQSQGYNRTPAPYVRLALLKYLDCGIFAHGFARACCDDCGHDYWVAFSSTGRRVCPSYILRTVDTAAHLSDHVFPRLPVRPWTLLVPKRLHYFLHREVTVLNMLLRIFLRVTVMMRKHARTTKSGEGSEAVASEAIRGAAARAAKSSSIRDPWTRFLASPERSNYPAQRWPEYPHDQRAAR